MAESKPTILITFDVEEFDMPLEYGQQVSEAEQMQVGYQGLEMIVNIWKSFSIKGTFFTTANFANNYPAAIRSLAANNEIASHTFYHSHFKNEDLLQSKLVLENITGTTVRGLRMPRLRPVEMMEVKKAGYGYDSSINPTWIPGRYNNFHLPRHPYVQEDVLRFPASVSPMFRIPLFWLSFKNMPYAFFLQLVKQSLAKDGHVCLYFHPWEFIDLDKYAIPRYTKRYAGEQLQKRLRQLINDLSHLGSFSSMEQYIRQHYLQPET
jgi:hypothetical protein